MSEPALWLSQMSVNRGAEYRARAGWMAALLADPATRVLATAGDRVAAGDGLVGRAPVPDDAARTPVWLGFSPGGEAWVCVRAEEPRDVAVDQPFEPEGDAGAQLAGLRSLAADLQPWESSLAGTAVALQRWHAGHGFCARCGHRTDVVDAGWRRQCPSCGAEHFPRTDPVVIVGIESPDGERFLLSRGRGWAPGRYSCPAGFVDAAESLEDAARREMREEVGLDLAELTLVGNQVWPFNGQIMCAFSARAAGEEITVDPHELDSARWVTRAELAAGLRSGEIGLPGQLAAGRWLIERWYGAPLEVSTGG